MNSMTGYGYGLAEQGNFQAKVEIASVNGKKQSDIRISAPKELSGLEIAIRQKIQENVVRGNLQVTISYVNSGTAVDVDGFDYERAVYWANVLNNFAAEQGMNPPEVCDVLQMPGVLKEDREKEVSEELQSAVLDALEDALVEWRENRHSEGEALREELLARGYLIQSLLTKIDERQDGALQEQKARLRDRIASLDPEIAMDEERLAREVVFYVDRADITEEIVRLKTHLAHYFDLLNSDEAIGRNLDFLGQEMNREITTLSSKTADLPIAEDALQMKIEISKLREQVMNVE